MTFTRFKSTIYRSLETIFNRLDGESSVGIPFVSLSAGALVKRVGFTNLSRFLVFMDRSCFRSSGSWTVLYVISLGLLLYESSNNVW